MWNIHGKVYDLTNFVEHHPGGSLILNSCKGKKDVSASFESYHSMRDMKKIKSIMKKYEIIGEIACEDFRFHENEFYSTLSKKVRTYFKNRQQSHHANIFWCIKSFLQVFLYSTTFYMASYLTYLPIYQRILLNMFSGHMFMQCGFGIMHDASHSAVSYNSYVNEILSGAWHGLAGWDNRIWCQHHVYMHHAYTGTKSDPDVIHFFPVIRKSHLENPERYIAFSKLRALVFMCILPGMFFGQSLVYTKTLITKRMFRLNILDYKYSLFENMLKLFTLTSFIYSGNVLVVLSFILTTNCTYFACILPDHDTFETHQNIEYDSKRCDWGELQVRNSGNFSTQNNIVNNCFGGINYQIEHHLFPTISHVHFPEVSKIVRQTCIDFDIPYVDHPTMYSAICSALHSFSEISKT